MVFHTYRMILYVIVLIELILLNFVCVFAANLRPKPAFPILQDKLDLVDDLAESLALDVCGDLHVYENKTSVKDCKTNFIKYTHKGSVPPELNLKCHYQSDVVYSVGAMKGPGRTLVVLTPHNATLDYLPYDLFGESDKKIRSLKLHQLDQYTLWSTLIFNDGSHSPWLQGPDIRPWNLTRDQQQRKYKIHIDPVHELEEDKTVNTRILWDSFDDEDICFYLVNHCNGKITQLQILSSSTHSRHSGSVSGLPLGASCSLRLTGRHGTTLHLYRTPSCHVKNSCIDTSVAQNISIVAEPGAAGWDVHVTWARHRQPLAYNVTLRWENVTRSVRLPGNKTEFTFADVEGDGIYRVLIGSVLQKTTEWTSARAIFPVESQRWGALGSALGGAWGALACVAALILALLWRRRRASSSGHHYYPEPKDMPPKDGECDADVESIAAEDDWELRSERLLLHEVIGEGAFGVVRRGTLAPAGKEVAVKMLKDLPTLDEIRSFRAEMELMKSVGAHPHIVSLVGCCSGRRPFIVAEYCNRGDLLSYLRCSWDVMVSKRNAKYYNNNIETTDYRNDLFKCKMQGEHSKLVVNKLYDLQGICDTDLTTRDLLSFCRQIAMGMEFLASNRLVHRDLAARNVLVSSDRTLKIADFGLSRDVYEENLYKQKGNGKMPMKWMALESLTRRIYTTQSDVWSFGVVMWEVASVGGSPYAGVPPARLPRLLRAGYRMPRPANCTKQLYEVMLSCWRAHPRERPTFVDLHAQLDELLNTACAHEYLSLELGDEAPPSLAPHKYVTMIIRDKLGWSRGESYSRPMRTAQSNHYSSPPAYVHKAHSVSVS